MKDTTHIELLRFLIPLLAAAAGGREYVIPPSAAERMLRSARAALLNSSEQAAREAFAEAERLREDSQLYHRVMQCLRNMDMPHGLCQPRERMACTHCNAKDQLEKLKMEYQGPRLRASR